ncbi:diacylglycerol/lipid kinase family protein [Chenggangzhangella methanolivorans]|uniref:diacylglycerol/lipid kinase family protein n=1 Tax=Chenggangzhangella methanolivorans TaxID=1437009 RepID=UPI00362001A7
MKVALVVNSSSGSLLGKPDAAAELEAKLRGAGLEVVAVLDGDASDLVSRMAQARDLSVDAIVTAGGDGTIATAAEALLGSDKALAPLPLGTMNLLAKDLGIPVDLDAAIAVFADAETTEIDVGDVNGHKFLCNSMLGVPARLAERRERNRLHMGVVGWWRHVIAGLKSMYRYPAMRIGLDLGDGPVTIRSKAVVVADNAYDEGFGHVLTRSRLDRGELTLYATRRLSAWPLVRLSIRMALGRWTDDVDLETHHVKELTVTSRRRLLRVMNDGETRLIAPPLKYRILPKALKVLRPKSAAPAPELESAA